MRRSPRLMALVGLLLLAGAGLALAAEQAKRQLESSLTQILQVPVRIQRVTFLPGELTLHRVWIQNPVEPAATTPLTVERLQIEGSWLSILRHGVFPVSKASAVRSIAVRELTLSFAGVPLWAQGRLTLAVGPDGTPRTNGWLSFRHPLVQGVVEVEGPPTAPVLMGWLEGPRSESGAGGRFGRRHFLTQLFLSTEVVELSQMQIQGGWSANGILSFPSSRGQAPPLSWKGLFRFSGPAGRFQFEVVPVEDRWTRVLVWMVREDLTPQQFAVEWTVRRSTLNLQAHLLGSEAVLSGWMDLDAPYPLEMALDLKHLQLGDVIEWFAEGLGRVHLTGQVRGRVTFSGTLHELVSRGELFGEGVRFNDLGIRSVTLRFRGLGPILRIEDAHLVRPKGTLVAEGAVDLRRLGQPDFFQAVKLTSTDRDFELAGWQLSPLAGWQSSATGVQVRRSGTEAGAPVGVNIRVNQDEEFVGVEHRGKF